MPLPPFHLAVTVTDLTATRRFYGELLQCEEGRSTETWVDFNFFGHQLSFHLRTEPSETHVSGVDGDRVPIPHFGAVLDPMAWRTLADRLIQAGVEFIIEPKTRFQGAVSEQSTMFFADPSGNHLEFKSMSQPDALFQVSAN